MKGRNAHGRAASNAPYGCAGVASEGRNRPGLLEEQEPRVTPSKRNSDGPLPYLEPTGLTNGTPEEVRSARGGVGVTANSQ
jgi:hypothetical protein